MPEQEKTPLSTADVKRRYSWGMAPHKSIPGGMYTVAAAAADFDRWLTVHDAEVRAAERAKMLGDFTDAATNARTIDAAAIVLDEHAFTERIKGSRKARRRARLLARATIEAAVVRFQRDARKRANREARNG
ncbi:hypothetical protein [Pseudoclavibacter sp. AY1H1]|uniref:hypothetical protein n=1 Tax=Pseudoclavibacter sp. AY1H1 TaxID=2080584 RepID=UPI000CE90AB3|nr:hypothetical protein [Pseudoclavibacter sp. AY1H1]PPF38358.1 hypothetical protein C5E05_04925 [Pseudoclavibacter sp. AY1H1]